MSDLHPNVLTYLAAMAALNRNDLTAVAEHVHPDFVYRIPGRSNIAGEFHGVVDPNSSVYDGHQIAIATHQFRRLFNALNYVGRRGGDSTDWAD